MSESELAPGVSFTRAFVVEHRLTTDLGGVLSRPVLSTPGMIQMLEETAYQGIHPYLPDGAFTVGFEVSVKHVGAAAEGTECTAVANLREITDARKFLFDVEVRQ